MNNKEMRQKDLIKLVEGIDISPSMYKNATEKYNAVGEHLQEHGLDCDIFPQGSFNYGTVVRPFKDLKDLDYDLDFVCCLKEKKESTSPQKVKMRVKEILCLSDVYKDKLVSTEWDKCWTLSYAEYNGVGFNIDIVPAVQEDLSQVQKMMDRSAYDSDKFEDVVAITNKKEKEYNWVTSNPKGYKIWFDEINEPYLQLSSEPQRRALYEDNRNIFGSIEDVPRALERSSLQRVIQILKRHRDVYFCRAKKESLKPTSAIITTICAEIAKDKTPTSDIFSLLQTIADEIEIYDSHRILEEEAFYKRYAGKKIIEKRSGVWMIVNPVNPYDNLADSWNEQPEKAKAFFEWVIQIKRDYVETVNLDDTNFVAILENNFGKKNVRSVINEDAYKLSASKEILNTPKPWRN